MVPMGELIDLVPKTVGDVPVSISSPTIVPPMVTHTFLQKVLTVDEEMEEDVEEEKEEGEGQVNDLTGESYAHACHVTVDADTTTLSDDQIEMVQCLLAAFSDSDAVHETLANAESSPLQSSPPPSPVSLRYSLRTSSPLSLSVNALVIDVANNNVERVGPHTKREGGLIVPDWDSPVLAAPTSFPAGTLLTPPFNHLFTPYARPSTSASIVSDALSYVDAPFASNDTVEVFAAIAAAPPLVRSPTVSTSFPFNLDLMHEPVDWSLLPAAPSSSVSTTSLSSDDTVLGDLTYPYTGKLKQFPEVPATQFFTTVRSPSVTTLEEEIFGTMTSDNAFIREENEREMRENAVHIHSFFFNPFSLKRSCLLPQPRPSSHVLPCMRPPPACLHRRTASSCTVVLFPLWRRPSLVDTSSTQFFPLHIVTSCALDAPSLSPLDMPRTCAWPSALAITLRDSISSHRTAIATLSLLYRNPNFAAAHSSTLSRSSSSRFFAPSSTTYTSQSLLTSFAPSPPSSILVHLMTKNTSSSFNSGSLVLWAPLETSPCLYKVSVSDVFIAALVSPCILCSQHAAYPCLVLLSSKNAVQVPVPVFHLPPSIIAA